MTDIISFDDALSKSEKMNKKHVLLGNGFSQACLSDIFNYGKLFEQADFSNLSSVARQAFDVMETTDFEVVMHALKCASKLVNLYSNNHAKLAEQFERDASGLREVLVSAIADSHPERPGDIEPERYQACKLFLKNFDDIYTVNYDLLLYWALMQGEIHPQVRCDDGFRQPDEGPQTWVTWDSSAHEQNVYYLHGSLHVYESGPEIQKYTWCNTQFALIDQIREALEEEKYPLFVSEGTSSQKMARIIRSSFLGRVYRSLENIGGALFVYGLSMSDNDSHILRAIVRSKITHLFVSVYDDPNNDANRQMIERVMHLTAQRTATSRSRHLDVSFYDAVSANVWG